jgi:hypothetical protein
MDINQKIFIMIIVILTLYLIYIQFYSNIERFTNTQTANEALQTMASIFTNQNATIGNLTATGNITVNGGIISNKLTVNDQIYTTGYVMKDRSIANSNSTLYRNGDLVYLYDDANGNILSIDKKGGLTTNGITAFGPISTPNLIFNKLPFGPNYFKFNNNCVQDNVYIASDASTISSIAKITAKEDNAYWFMVNGNRLCNKQYGTCLTDDGSGKYSLKPYDPANINQGIHKGEGAGFGLWNIAANQRLGGGTNIARYYGSNGNDCNWYFNTQF